MRYAFACWHWTAATVACARDYLVAHPDTHLIIAWQPANRPRDEEVTRAFEEMKTRARAVSFFNVPLYGWRSALALARGAPLRPATDLAKDAFLAKLTRTVLALRKRGLEGAVARIEAFQKFFRGVSDAPRSEAEWLRELAPFLTKAPDAPGALHGLTVLQLFGLSPDDARDVALAVAAEERCSVGASSVRWFGKFLVPTAGCQSDLANFIWAFLRTGPPLDGVTFPAVAIADDDVAGAVAFETHVAAAMEEANLAREAPVDALFLDLEHDDLKVKAVAPKAQVYAQVHPDLYAALQKFHPGATWLIDNDARNAAVVRMAHGLQ